MVGSPTKECAVGAGVFRGGMRGRAYVVRTAADDERGADTGCAVNICSKLISSVAVVQHLAAGSAAAHGSGQGHELDFFHLSNQFAVLNVPFWIVNSIIAQKICFVKRAVHFRCFLPHGIRFPTDSAMRTRHSRRSFAFLVNSSA